MYVNFDHYGHHIPTIQHATPTPLNPPYTNVVGCYDIRQTQFPLHLYILSGLQLYTIIYIVLGLTVRGG